MKEVRKRKTNIVYYHIYVESRKMVLMNPFGVETQCGKERVGRIERAAWKHTHDRV